MSINTDTDSNLAQLKIERADLEPYLHDLCVDVIENPARSNTTTLKRLGRRIKTQLDKDYGANVKYKEVRKAIGHVINKHDYVEREGTRTVHVVPENL